MLRMIFAALLATAALASGEAMATQVNITAANPVIDLTITESVDAKPDIATFSTTK